MRKRLDTYANLVHSFSLPGLKTRHEGIDIVVIRRAFALLFLAGPCLQGESGCLVAWQALCPNMQGHLLAAKYSSAEQQRAF